MSAIELRNRIIKEVNSISDVAILNEIYKLLQIEQNIEYKLSEQETHAVQEGIDDIHQGRVLTSKEANSFIAEWLKK